MLELRQLRYVLHVIYHIYNITIQNYVYIHNKLCVSTSLSYTASSMTNHRTFTDFFCLLVISTDANFHPRRRLEQIREDRFLEMEKQFLGAGDFHRVLMVENFCVWNVCDVNGQFFRGKLGQFWTSNFICPVRCLFPGSAEFFQEKCERRTATKSLLNVFGHSLYLNLLTAKTDNGEMTRQYEGISTVRLRCTTKELQKDA